jgi:hypothetical protein
MTYGYIEMLVHNICKNSTNVYIWHFSLNEVRFGYLKQRNGRPYSLLVMIDWLIDYLRFYVPPKNFSPIWRSHHYRWRAAKFRPILGDHCLWAGRDLYRATPAVTRDNSFPGLIRRNAPFSRLLWHTRGCGGPILTRILTGLLVMIF